MQSEKRLLIRTTELRFQDKQRHKTHRRNVISYG